MTLEVKFGDGMGIGSLDVEMECGGQDFAEVREGHGSMTLKQFGEILAKIANVKDGTIYIDNIGFRWVRRK